MPRFERVTGRSRVAVAAAVAGLVFAAAAGVGLAQITASSTATAAPSATTSMGQAKVAICHRRKSKKHPFRTITVGAPAVQAHLNHGDKTGACPVTTTPTLQATTAPNAGGNGKGHGKGK